MTVPSAMEDSSAAVNSLVDELVDELHAGEEQRASAQNGLEACNGNGAVCSPRRDGHNAEQQQEECEEGSGEEVEEGDAPHSSSSSSDASAEVTAAEQQQQLPASPRSGDEDQITLLRSENERLEADRREMGQRLGEYRAAVAKLEGAVTSGERRVRQQAEELEAIKAECADLREQLEAASGRADATPDRCRAARAAAEGAADAAAAAARAAEARAARLCALLARGAADKEGLREFADWERAVAVERVEELETQAAEANQRAADAEARAAAAQAAADAAAVELAAARAAAEAAAAEAAAARQRGEEEAGRAARAEVEAAKFRAERDAAAGNLVKAEQELAAVGDYSSKMFRQVRFIGHVLEKHASAISRVPELLSLAKNLKSFIAAAGRHWDASGACAGPDASATAALSAFTASAAAMSASVGGITAAALPAASASIGGGAAAAVAAAGVGGDEAVSADAAHGDRDSRRTLRSGARF